VTNSPKPKVVAVVGATATGKTPVAVELALTLNGEVVNGDSRLFYRGMDVATAKPTNPEMRGVPHHLIDFLDPNEKFSLAEYLDRARATIEEISTRGKLPVLVGGSGQYLWALIEGWEVPQIEPDSELRDELERLLDIDGVGALSERLKQIAPGVAATTDLKNPRRVIRAIERVQSGITDTSSSRQKAKEPPYDVKIIGLAVERASLHQRVLDRLSSMLESGWKNEVESLLASGYSIDDYSLSGIGYRQMIGHIQGEYDLDEAVRLTAVATNRLIRQQNNWFRQDDERIEWHDMTEQAESSVKLVISSVRDWLSDDENNAHTQ